MQKIKKIQVTAGVYWIEIPEADLYLLCGSPADSVKHLKKKGLINPIEKDGAKFETGPNAILLSDVLVQNGSFSNLTEFPVLQMLYLQGMIIPNHPNNKGIKPMLIGTNEQIDAQLEYIYRGNYGLVSKEEILEAGVAEAEAEEMMRIKLKFAFGRISTSDNLVDTCRVGQAKEHLRNNVFIERIGFNRYEISYGDETVSVDLKLNNEERYEAAYQLDYHFIKREYFAVIHSGEGDGWDINRPCMASILMYQGKIYLIDAGPNILTSLNYLGISVNEIEGIFQTHVHDDHFAGLSTLARSDHRFKLYSSKLVRKSIEKKMCALMAISEKQFSNFFDINDLEFDQWTNVDGLEVKPVYSPHPVDTNIFYFRVKWQGDYKVYAHLADTTSFNVCKNMIADSPSDLGMSKEKFEKIKADYLAKVDLKKIDIGGGMIHGEAEDFRHDDSDKIVLAHTHSPLTMSQREVGSSASFGNVDVLIPTNRDYLQGFAESHLRFYFPEAPTHEVDFLLNHPIVSFNAGSILHKKGTSIEHVYLLVTGSVEFTDTRTGMPNTFSAGSLIGFYSGYLGMNATETYWASSNIYALQIPTVSYNEFIQRNKLYAKLKRMEENILFLSDSWLFNEIVSFPILTKIANSMNSVSFPQDTTLNNFELESFYLLKEGKAYIFSENGEEKIEELERGDFFSTQSILPDLVGRFKIKINAGSTFFTIPSEMTTSIPIVYWKILETHEKRARQS